MLGNYRNSKAERNYLEEVKMKLRGNRHQNPRLLYQKLRKMLSTTLARRKPQKRSHLYFKENSLRIRRFLNRGVKK